MTSQALEPHSVNTSPLISVIIPSRQRPQLLLRAVRSVLEQQRNDLEIIVVLDGDTADSAALLRATYERGVPICVLQNESRVGAAAARNQGVGAARGAWIAFLDDDDEWLPGKLDKQMDRALQSRYSDPIVSCQLIARDLRGDKVRPVNPPSLPLSEYLFVRKGLFTPSGLLQTSTLVAPRGLLLRVPFARGLARHQDYDWTLRAAAHAGVGVEFVAQPLVCWHIEDDRCDRISTSSDWRCSLEWAKSLGPVLSPRAYASFLLCQASTAAAQERDWLGMTTLFCEALRNGSPHLSDVLLGLLVSLGTSFQMTKRLSQMLFPGRWLRPGKGNASLAQSRRLFSLSPRSSLRME